MINTDDINYVPSCVWCPFVGFNVQIPASLCKSSKMIKLNLPNFGAITN